MSIDPQRAVGWLNRTHALEGFSAVLGAFTTLFGALLVLLPERLHPHPPQPPLNTYRVALRWASPEAWGVLFIAIGLCVLVSVIVVNRAARIPLGIATSIWSLWALLLFWPAVQDHHALPTTALAFAFPAGCSLLATVIYQRDEGAHR